MQLVGLRYWEKMKLSYLYLSINETGKRNDLLSEHLTIWHLRFYWGQDMVRLALFLSSGAIIAKIHSFARAELSIYYEFNLI